MPSNVVGNTFRAIELEPQATAELEFSKFVEALLQKLQLLKEERFVYYEDLRKKNTKWANGSRWVLALLGSIAFLLTGLAAALRFAPEASLQKWSLDGFDKGVLLAVLAIYAVMGAISFYEKGTDKTTAYFRHLGIILAIRDLWTKVQFEFLKALTALKSAADQKAAADARAAAKTVEEASKPGALNLALSGDFDDQVLISVDDVEVARSRGKTIALARVVPGLRKISAHAKKGTKEVETALMVDVKPGLQDLKLVLS